MSIVDCHATVRQPLILRIAVFYALYQISYSYFLCVTWLDELIVKKM